MFPFVPGRPVLAIDQLLLLFETPDAVGGRHHLVRFRSDDVGCDRVEDVECVADGAWPGFFRGTIDLRPQPLGPLQEARSVNCSFEIPADAGEIRRVFVVASYDATGHHAVPCRPEG